MVVIGHVDAGKSTLMGNLLFKVGVVDKKVIHKYEQVSGFIKCSSKLISIISGFKEAR